MSLDSPLTLSNSLAPLMTTSSGEKIPALFNFIRVVGPTFSRSVSLNSSIQ